MKNRTNMHLAVRLSLVLALALAIWSPLQAQSADPAEGKNMAGAKTMPCCEAMKAQKQKMMEDMKAQDAELAAQVASMNSAPDDKKMGLMAAVITKMVEQRIARDAQMAKMHEDMMQHMQMCKDSTSQCPSMKGMKDMKGMDEKPGDAQKEQK